MSMVVATAVFGAGLWLGVAVRSGGAGRSAQYSVVDAPAEIVALGLSDPVAEPAPYVPPPWPARPVSVDARQLAGARTSEDGRVTDRQVGQPENPPEDEPKDQTEDQTEDEPKDQTEDEPEDDTEDGPKDEPEDEPVLPNQIKEKILDQLEEQPALEDVLNDVLEGAKTTDENAPDPAEAVEAEQSSPDEEGDAHDVQDADLDSTHDEE
ncbi:MAG: hypothetical protein ACRDYA_23800 [Egibacteraceae bacterium]